MIPFDWVSKGRTVRLRTLLILIAVVAVPWGLGLTRMRQQKLGEMLAQPLHEASERGDVEAIRSLLDDGADVNAIVNGRYNWTPLMNAAFRGHVEAARLLLDRGANVNHECRDFFTALTLAAGEGHWDVVRLLAERGGDVRHADATGQSALGRARTARNTKLAEFLESTGHHH